MPECERCRGVGFEIATRKGPDGNDVEIAQRCRCQQPERVENEAALLKRLRIPLRYEHCSFAFYEIGPASSRLQKEALSLSLNYCARYPARCAAPGNDAGLGLFFTGLNGTGKTHLAVATLRELVTQYGARGQFWDFHELLREIRNCYNPSTELTEYEMLEPIIETEILLLDDLGAWKMTDWMKDTLFYILNRRYLARRPSIITTNYPDKDHSPAELTQTDSNVRAEYLVDRIGPKLRSRLLEACTVVQLDGSDRRQFAMQPRNLNLLS
jgi:DNA replication protein DnaC